MLDPDTTHTHASRRFKDTQHGLYITSHTQALMPPKPKPVVVSLRISLICPTSLHSVCMAPPPPLLPLPPQHTHRVLCIPHTMQLSLLRRSLCLRPSHPPLG